METKSALVIAARGGFVNGFLLHDLDLLQDLGYKVHVAANDNGMGYIEGVLMERGIGFHQVDFSSKNPFTKENLLAYKQIKAILKNVAPQVVHCHTAIAGAITRLVVLFNRRNKPYLVYTTHGFNFHSLSSKKSWLVYYNIEKFLSRFTNMIITINKEDYKNAKKMLCKDVRYINGVGVNLNRFDHVVLDRKAYRNNIGILDNDLMVFSVGELSPRKNHATVIRAIKESGIKNIVYCIAGGSVKDVSTETELLRLAEDLGVRLKLLGFRKDIPELCCCANIGAIPSVQEGLGLAGIEQLRCGVPVLGAKVQGIMDYIVDGRNGYLFEPYDVKGFAEGLNLLKDGEVRKSMKTYCIKSVEKFDCSVSFKQMSNIYRSIDEQVTTK